MKTCFLTVVAAFMILSVSAAETLESRIAEIVGNTDMGVAVINGWGDTISVNGDKRYELQSVMKFHQALAMAKTMSATELLNTKVSYGAEDLKPDTWSPLRAVNINGGTAELSTLLYYSLRMSDNNAADILFDRFLSPRQVDSLLRKDTPARDFGIAWGEAEMHADHARSAANWSTPLDCAGLFNYTFAQDTTSSLAALQAVMASRSAFGNSRIVKGLGKGATAFNKTGTGFSKGELVSTVNDAAFVYFPYATGGFGHYSIAVFSADCRPDEAEAKIAEISELVWSYHIMKANDLAANSLSVGSAARRRKADSVQESDGSLGQILGAAVLGAFVVDEIIQRVNDYNSSHSDDDRSGYKDKSSKKSGEGSRSTSQRRRPR